MSSPIVREKSTYSLPEQSSRMGLSASALAVLCCAFWGGNSVAVKITVEHIPPGGCAGLRFLISLGVIYLWCRVEGTDLRPKREHLWPIVISGMLMFAQILA